MVDCYHPNDVRLPGFYLAMNLMRDRAESVRVVGPFPTREAAVAYHESERRLDAEGKPTTVTVDGMVHSFKEGPMDWLNPLDHSELHTKPGPFGHGVFELKPVEVLDWFARY